MICKKPLPPRENGKNEKGRKASSTK